MIELYSLGSSSRGNAFVVRTGADTWLIDAGLSAREISLRLRENSIDPADLSGVWITHEHGDHIRGLAVLLRRHTFPVYISHGCLQAANLNLPPERITFIRAGDEIGTGSAIVRVRSKLHDAADPLLFTFRYGGRAVSIITDLGSVDDEAMAAVNESDAIVLEANHCEHMLRKGPYPAFLKRRIAGDLGHLSNNQAATLILRAASPKLRQVMLAHISRQNNTPGTALASVAGAIAQWPGSARLNLSVAPQDGGSLPLRIRVVHESGLTPKGIL